MKKILFTLFVCILLSSFFSGEINSINDKIESRPHLFMSLERFYNWRAIDAI